MTTIRPIFTAGRLRVSKIVYFRDLTDSVVKPIPLGVMCDVAVGEVYGLSLMARRSLPKELLDRVGEMMRAPLAHPFELLRKEFNLIWDESDKRPQAFGDVVKRYSASLRFMPLQIKNLSVPTNLRANSENLNGLTGWARDEMCGARNHEFWALIGEADDSEATDVRRGVLVQTNRAAA